jgi:hypothetical protein
MQPCGVEFYMKDVLPDPLRKEAEQKKFELGEGMIAVWTWMDDDGNIDYRFDNVGMSPHDLVDYVHLIAERDGIGDLNSVIKKAWGDNEE